MQSTLEQGGTRASEHTDEGDQQGTEGEGEGASLRGMHVNDNN